MILRMPYPAAFRLMQLLFLPAVALQLLASTLHAQSTDLRYGQFHEPLFEHLSTRQGLSHSFVNCMLQDQEGFMWFGTQDGLNRFDGYTFLTLEHDATKPNSLSSNTIRCIGKDREGTLWVGTDTGLNKLDKTTNTFSLYLPPPKNSKSSKKKLHKIKAIYEDHQGILWVGTYGGLIKLDKKTGAFTLYEHKPNHTDQWTHNYINAIYEDRQGSLWVGTTQGLSLFDRKTSTFTRFPHSNSKNDNQHLVSCILEDKTGLLWVATATDGLLAFDRKTRTFKVYTANPPDPTSLGGNNVLALFEDSFGTFWIGTQAGGLNRFDRKTGTFVQYVHHSAQPHSINANSISCIYEDRSKVLWVSTQDNGLSKLDLLKKRITHLKHDSGKNNHLYNNFVSAVYEDRSGTIWIGGNLGLDRLDRKTGQFTHYTYPAPASKVIGTNATFCIYEDKAGHIWVGLHGGGLQKLNPATRTFTSFLHDPTDSLSLPHSAVNAIHQDKAGTLWVGTRFGLAKLNEKTNQFTNYLPFTSPTEGKGGNVLSIAEQADGKLWLTTANHGLYELDPSRVRFRRLLPNDQKFQRACHQGITFGFRDSAGSIWVGFQSGGLARVDTRANTCQFIQQPSALTKVVVTTMQEDTRGNLWIATSKNGLYQFNPKTLALTTYDDHDGLQSNQFLSASCKSQTGELYFGGTNGLNYFMPGDIHPNPYAPPVAISGFKVFDQPRPFAKELTLPYRDNFFSFDFVALSYALPEKNQYAYQLEGFDHDWIQAGTRRYASYTNLDPGAYVFRVKAANHDGAWNRQGTTIHITITPPWWKTNLAYLGYGLLVLAAGYAIRAYTISQERLRTNLKLKSLESKKLQELDQLKSRFFTSVSHEFRTPLTLILSPLEKKLAALAPDHPEAVETKLMHRNAHRLLELINQLLDISKLEAGKMNVDLESGDIMGLLKAQVFAFASLAQSKGIALTCAAQPQTLVVLFDKDKLEKILTNLLSNAIKFTPAQGQVDVHLRVVERPDQATQHLVLEVQDTGVGIPAERLDRIFDRFYQVDSSHTRPFEGTGIGLALTQELIELLKGRIRVTSTLGQGSQFTVELPLQTAQLEEIEKATYPPQSVVPAVADVEPAAIPNQADESAPLLLLVEDNADLRHYIRASFEQHYRVLEAVDGKQGLQMAVEHIPDLVISDWMMPHMDGLQLCQCLKSDERTSHIPIILLTAKATVESRIEGLQTGADDYLTKPFHAGELAVRAQNLIEQRQRLRQQFSLQFNQALTSFAEAPVPKLTSLVSIPTNEPALAMNPLDDKFLQRLDKVIEANLADTEFTIDMLEKEVGMSHAHFNRKLNALTDQSPNEYLRNYRLRKAALLLSQKHCNVSEVAYEVGFAHLSYFTRCFRQVYGQTPSQYASHAQKSTRLNK